MFTLKPGVAKWILSAVVVAAGAVGLLWFLPETSPTKSLAAATAKTAGKGRVPAEGENFAWTARIFGKDGASCGGSIVHENWILTAGHCMCPNVQADRPSVFHLRTPDGYVDEYEFSVEPEDVVAHEGYRYSARLEYHDHVDDIALFRVDLSARRELLAEISRATESDEMDGQGKVLESAEVAVWHSASDDIQDRNPESRLFFATKKVHIPASCESHADDCEFIQSPYEASPLPLKRGDSGSGLTTQPGSGAKLLGVAVYIDEGQQDTYLRTSQYHDWIKNVIDGKVTYEQNSAHCKTP